MAVLRPARNRTAMVVVFPISSRVSAPILNNGSAVQCVLNFKGGGEGDVRAVAIMRILGVLEVKGE